ncbi:hypothetical protein LEP3755_66380 (plasmid) [Leptolyngbya sp. NIES-3755]|nr:hypothetical protein LEP3755_66380 [Leptolyngbya sp. NIES-3755]
MLLNLSLPAKITSSLTLISLMSLSIGCNQTVQSKAIPSAVETPASTPVIAQSPSEPSQSLPESNEIANSTILEGRYWIGHTGQALEVEGDRYRYETEGGTQPWRSITELQAVKEGVIYDGNSYWCLSSMAPQGQVASCSEKGWITTPESNPL